MRNPSPSQGRAFLRHRFRAHVQGWLAVAVGLLWGYYTDLYWHEPLWAVLPAAYLAAFFFVAMLVAVAAVLRFPWWLLAPLCLVSMACEWALRRLLRRPWVRSPQPRERFLSNPFALWQGWRARRKARRAKGVFPKNPSRPSGAAVIPFPACSVSHAMRSQPTRAEVSWRGVGEYIAAAFEDHWKFWCYSSLLWIGLWLWLVENMSFVAALIVAFILTFIFTLLLVIPLSAALLALFSTLLFAAGMTPQQRLEAAASLRLAQAAQNEARAPAPQPAAQKPHWIWPLLIGLWIGNAWGDD